MLPVVAAFTVFEKTADVFALNRRQWKRQSPSCASRYLIEGVRGRALIDQMEGVERRDGLGIGTLEQVRIDVQSEFHGRVAEPLLDHLRIEARDRRQQRRVGVAQFVELEDRQPGPPSASVNTHPAGSASAGRSSRNATTAAAGSETVRRPLRILGKST